MGEEILMNFESMDWGGWMQALDKPQHAAEESNEVTFTVTMRFFLETDFGSCFAWGTCAKHVAGRIKGPIQSTTAADLSQVTPGKEVLTSMGSFLNLVAKG